MILDPFEVGGVSGERRYAWRYGWGWAWSDVRRGAFLVALRTFWWAIVRGWIGETCADCGRPYPLWRAPDHLWAALGGAKAGLLCPYCFDRRARRARLPLRWVATQWRPPDESTAKHSAVHGAPEFESWWAELDVFGAFEPKPSNLIQDFAKIAACAAWNHLAVPAQLHEAAREVAAMPCGPESRGLYCDAGHGRWPCAIENLRAALDSKEGA